MSHPEKKILAIKLRSLGDTVLFTAPLLELRRLYPQAQIHVAVPTEWASVLIGMPGIDHIWEYQRSPHKLVRAARLAEFGIQLRKENYDLVLNFHASPSSALLARATGAKVRSVHFHGHRSKNRFSTLKIPGKGTLKPIIERDLDTIRAAEKSQPIPLGTFPKIFTNDAELGKAQEIINSLGLKQPLLGINLGASRPTKIWPIGHFVRLAISWVHEEKGSVLVLAGPNEMKLVQQFEKLVEERCSDRLRGARTSGMPLVSADPSLELFKQIKILNSLDIRTLAAVIQKLTVLVGNDSGPKHIAVAVNTPTVTLFGPEHPYEWHPYPTEQHPYFFIEGLRCRASADPKMPPWCGLANCEIELHKCMKLIGVDPVLKECQRIKKKL